MPSTINRIKRLSTQLYIRDLTKEMELQDLLYGNDVKKNTKNRLSSHEILAKIHRLVNTIQEQKQQNEQEKEQDIEKLHDELDYIKNEFNAFLQHIWYCEGTLYGFDPPKELESDWNKTYQSYNPANCENHKHFI